ncbi:MAG: thioredoxin family protein [Candidatus Heimdallarchaeum aukensis]|uniref:Thioredoxin family protein n=1 Tax=Candidatus Heimdallarchaeum aukensis TaxID=2876573 RepID=A0A9Y1BMG6_9ARCH|nr:MAG: thioredoxin family protein [Candidatus Heimdallarchaeum aukensis]UJG41783.1 MAG: thioredoxin family protein [Candidatus Heimdallarchaeum aukensis]
MHKILYFKSKTCNWCPFVESILKKIVSEKSTLELEVIDIEENYEIAEKYNIIAVPTIILPNSTKIVGATDETFLRQQLSFFL